MIQEFDQNFYRSQSQKRLRLVYEYARNDLEAGQNIDPYRLSMEIAGVDLSKMFSGPERNMWHDIRARGRYLHFYPEFPVGDDVVDFVEPHKMIAIEIDSRLHTKAKDSLKDQRLRAAGYRVIRIDQKNTNANAEDLWDEIRSLEELELTDVVEHKRSKLPLNSEIIVQTLRNEHTPPTARNINDTIEFITLADVTNSEEFKVFHKKYVAEIPQELTAAIAAIPLFK